MVQQAAENPFAARARYYAHYRPGYPVGILETLRQECGLTDRSIILDVGAGTGISSELFLKNGSPVWAVEPCREMRLEAQARLAGHPGYTSLEGTAEALPLPDDSVDLVTAGQAFHWFEPAAARAEFSRVSRRPGWVALFWNRYARDASPAMRAYSNLVAEYFGPPRHHGQVDIEAFFQRPVPRFEFENDQLEDFERVRGGLLSHSRSPLPGDPRAEAMLSDLRRWFERYEKSGLVRFPCQTELFIGCLDAGR